MQPLAHEPAGQGFNGATLGRAWKRERADRMLQLLGSFNGATLGRAWKLCFGSIRIRSSSSFNGATLGRAWKRSLLQPLWLAETASMGPRSVERGNVNAYLLPFFRCLASMGPRSVERGNHHNEPRRGLCHHKLQWGHAR